MSAMARTLVTRTAQDQILALDDDERDAVDAAVENLSEESGEPIDLPAALKGAAYRAIKTSGGDTPVVIYRAVPEGEGGGWLILSLMSPDEYKDVLEVQERLAEVPAARDLVETVLAGVSPESSRGGSRPRGLRGPVQDMGELVIGGARLLRFTKAGETETRREAGEEAQRGS